MTIQIVAEGPAYRVEDDVQMPDGPGDKHREMAILRCEYLLERTLEEPHAALGYYLSERAHTLANAMFTDETGAGWDISASDPSEWTVTVDGDLDTIVASAEQAADHQGRDLADVLGTWAQYDRAPDVIMAALEQQTDDSTPEASA